MVEFEIGLVYQKDKRFFIAIDPSTLVSCRNGVVSRIRPNTQYSAVRSISVEDLCDEWRIELNQFDLLMGEFLNPPQSAVKTRPRGTRRRKDDDEDYWKRHRTGRISRPKL